MKIIKNVLIAIMILVIVLVITNANADLGGQEINKLMMKVANEKPNLFVVVPSLGQKRYLSYMKQVELVIGNSSSGILESPYLGIPTVNIGERQKGRYRCKNIVQSGIEKNEIEQSIKEAMSGKYSMSSTYWGNGNASGNIVRVLKNA